jgi:hypothetical protein
MQSLVIVEYKMNHIKNKKFPKRDSWMENIYPTGRILFPELRTLYAFVFNE